MLLILSSVAFCIAFNVSSSLFAMSALAVVCFTSKASVRVVSWAASSKIVPVGSWTAWAFSFLHVFALLNLLQHWLLHFSGLHCCHSHQPEEHVTSSQFLRPRTSCWPWDLDLIWPHSPLLPPPLHFVVSGSGTIHQ